MSYPAPALGRIGHYQIYEELAEGGMSRVFLAQRDGSSQLCVLKQLHVDLEEHSTASIRFQREAHLVSQLDHPNIARVIDAGLEDGKFCIAMELIEGCTIHQLLEAMARRRQVAPPALTMTIAIEVLSGLAYAHALRGEDGRHLEIVHRDLTPKNVMISYDGRAKIIDFGVAQGRIDSFRTAPGMMVGTLHYMSPEQALTEKTDHRSDIYSLSVMLWELLAGEPAVQDGKAVHVLEQVIDVTPRALHLIDPGLPRAVSDVIMRGLAKEPEVRWQSAATYRDALVASVRPFAASTSMQIGAFVREVFPPERQPYARWSKLNRRHVDGLADAPTIADGSVEQFQLYAPMVPPDPQDAPDTISDDAPTLMPTQSGSEITRPDTPARVPSFGARAELVSRIEELEATVKRQRRVILLLALLLIAALALIGVGVGSGTQS